jgi:hypothetical protein
VAADFEETLHVTKEKLRSYSVFDKRKKKIKIQVYASQKEGEMANN